MTEVLIKLLKQQQEATQLFSNPSFHLVLQILLLLQKNSDKKLKCKVPGCKYKKDISIVKMRLHIAWHIMNKDFKDDSHRCGYCGVVGCTTMHINH